MSSPFDDTPESLVQLRTTVRDWVKKSREAVLSFRRDNGSFWRDTKQYRKDKGNPGENLSPTVTARSYTALVAADRCLEGISDGGDDDWKIWFAKFVEEKRFGIVDDAKDIKDIDSIRDLTRTPDGGHLNRFEVAHLADFVLAADYVDRFFKDGKKLPNVKLLPGIDKSEFKPELERLFLEAFKNCKQKNIAEEGQILFDADAPDSRHYFVTLHALRALSILGVEHRLRPEYFDDLSNHAQQFCMEQCFYTHRRIQHRQDTFRLAFAGVIYCLYSRSVDKELCMAIIEALAEAQQENGRWMSTHPIDRGDKGLWHIASPEIALCLTWLYFQPRVPDTARVLLIDMMEKYFTRWVVPTFVRVTKSPNKGNAKERTFEGWYGDHTVERDSVIGWATAVICHFLANYHAVLDDHINRRVIETLGLQASSKKYLIDETEHEKSPSWTRPVPRKGAEDPEKRPNLVTWPDIRPFA